VLVPAAEEDLSRIFSYVADDTVDAAIRVLDRFEEVFNTLAANPHLGHSRDDLTARPLRFFPVFSYLVIYLPETAPLQIIRVLSCARDIERLIG
jgi:plasmid stabilization system protein ParE